MRCLQEKPASFIAKLCNILRSKQYAKIICWDVEHRGIRVLNQKRLEEVILPKYFRHNRFTSFVRQLNMYDFHKSHLEDHRSIFLHPSFNPKNKENIHLIRRKTANGRQDNSASEEKRQADIQMDEKEDYVPCEQIGRTSRAALLDKHSLKVLFSDSTNLIALSREQALAAVMTELLPLIKDKNGFQNKKRELRGDRRFGNYLKQNQFLRGLYARMGLNMDEQSLLQLSIEDELLFKTKKSLVPKSLRMLESGPLNYCLKRDTLVNFLNI